MLRANVIEVELVNVEEERVEEERVEKERRVPQGKTWNTPASLIIGLEIAPFFLNLVREKS